MKDEVYSGTEVLESLTLAKNYNSYILREIRRHCDTNSTVLDFGAGKGVFSHPLQRHVKKLAALEPDPRLRGELGESKLLEVVGDLSELQPPFDLIFLINVLEHIEDDSGTLESLAGLMSESGLVLIYVPASPLLFSDFDRAVGHWRRYTKQTLLSSAERAGLSVLSIKYVDPLGWVVAMLHKLGGGRPGLQDWQLWVFDRLVFPLSRLLEPWTTKMFGKNLLLVARKSSTKKAE